MASYIRRRKFLATLGSAAAAWPLAARAQQPAMPVVGYMSGLSPEAQPRLLAAFRQGLSETGYTEEHNIKIEYRWAEHRYDRLPEMAADLVRRQVAVIAATTTPAALAAKAATAAIPIVFETGADPIRLGLVASLNRPGGNITGVTQLNEQVAPKRLELLHELVPTASVIALLVNPIGPALAEGFARSLQAAAPGLGLQVHVLHASTERDFDAVFANLIQLPAGGLVIGPDPFLVSRSARIAALTVRHAVPAVFETREFVAAGGLASYGGSFTDTYRLAGVYVARILKGAKPADLPVQQGTKVELFLKPQDREGARHHRPAGTVRPRGRGDRMTK
jgi:putative ABC transport system substrate-binding protein